MISLPFRNPAFRQPPRAAPEDPGARSGGRRKTATLFLAGDVMTGRGIDQILPHPGDPRLFEGYLSSATDYVGLAESANGPIAKPVDFAYVWGDALEELARYRPDRRIINLETAVTRSDDAEPKGINYRMNPANLPVLTAAAIDCCVLANNHVLDWGRAGLLETLTSLDAAGLRTAGAGRTLREAAAPALLPLAGGGRVIVVALGSASSGIPRWWGAKAREPGINLLPDLSPGTVAELAESVRAAKRPGDIVVASIHWGGNWGYEIPRAQIDFAHGLIEQAGVDIVHGHSSHHPKAIEVHRGRLVLYGCGDLLNDYEGIGGYEAYRGDLTLMYLPTIETSTGALVGLTLVPLRIRNFQLHRADGEDAAWLSAMLNREGRRFATGVRTAADGSLRLVWG
ncbi:MAG: CapA family protein [Inquilinus sp.]|nr:CapA family protein [Inquilinus sp.]